MGDSSKSCCAMTNPCREVLYREASIIMENEKCRLVLKFDG